MKPKIPAKPSIAPNTTRAAPIATHNTYWMKAFWGSLLFMFLALAFAGYDSGVGSDEMDMNIYGKANIAYYTSGFKDTTFLHPNHQDGTVLAHTLPYYGSGFEYFATALTSFLGNDYEYNTRHIFNQFIAILGILFTGLIILRLKNIKAALLGMWLMYLTPLFFGLAIFDTKDIPFLSAYIACLYFTIVFFQQLPRVHYKTLFGLCFSLWFLLSIRIGGVLMIGYIGLYALMQILSNQHLKTTLGTWLPKLIGSIVVAIIFMVVLWPFVLQSPIENTIKALNVVKDFPQAITLTFEGELIDSLNIPKSFLSKMFWISMPIAALATLVLGALGNLFLWRSASHKNALIILAIAALLPPFFAIYTNMPLYNSWRHLLFVYPALVAFCSIGFIALMELLPNTKIQIAIVAILALGFVQPTVWGIRNNPYQYTYYNQLAGGYPQAYYDYDTDYWQISTKEAIDWLMKNEPMTASTDTQFIATNAYTFSNYYLSHRYPSVKVKAVPMGEKTNYGAPGVYTIFNSLFLEPHYLQICFPSPLSIHTIDIEGMPATYIAKDTAQYRYKGFLAFQSNDYRRADSFFNLYTQQIKYDGSQRNLSPIFGAMAYCKFAIDSIQTAYTMAANTLKVYPADYLANLTLGVCCLARKDYPAAKQYLMIAQQITPGDKAPQIYLDMIPK
ncbi:MAG: hypothetical protein IT256_01250 [Chitinophagaceae bacterium]|nr:hypothetical protein [Chitinophagaceae bacterium]